jgi:hypothetical protein
MHKTSALIFGELLVHGASSHTTYTCSKHSMEQGRS